MRKAYRYENVDFTDSDEVFVGGTLADRSPSKVDHNGWNGLSVDSCRLVLERGGLRIDGQKVQIRGCSFFFGAALRICCRIVGKD